MVLQRSVPVVAARDLSYCSGVVRREIWSSAPSPGPVRSALPDVPARFGQRRIGVEKD